MPVYGAMQEYTAGLEPTLYPGYHQQDHWALAYKGEWTEQRVGESANRRISESALADYRQADDPGASVHCVYEGIALTLVPGPGAGEIDVSIDGAAPQRKTLNGKPIRLAGGLVSARHEMALTVVAGEVSIDGFIVQRPWSPSLWLIAGAVGALAAAVILLRQARR
jgi:hypothetical protein